MGISTVERSRSVLCHLGLTVGALLLLGCPPPVTEETETGPTAVNCAATESSKDAIPPIPNTIDGTCAAIPADFAGVEQQGNFDLYSWLIFIALNWPADAATCTGDPAKSILTSPGDPVWLTYLEDSQVFAPAGQHPTPWCPAASAEDRGALLAGLPPKVRALAEQHPEARLFLHHSSKTTNRQALAPLADTLGDPGLHGVLQSTGDILVDQNGRWARFTVSVNETEYDFLTGKTTNQPLWTRADQKAAGPIAFPDGSIELKAAWKVLGPGDDPSRFFTAWAIVYNDVSGDPSPGPNPVQVGLVGLHINQKTPLQKEWIWSTFEQVDNDTRSFFNPSCPASECPPNTTTVSDPATAQELDADGKPNYKPAQVVAVTPTSAPELNAIFQKLLAGTVWSNYQLISTQWTGEAPPGPKPAKLGNSVQETFVADGPMYSCIDCHGHARAWGGQQADFSWLLHFGPQQ